MIRRFFGWIGGHIAARIIGLLVLIGAPFMILQDLFERQPMDSEYWLSVGEVLGNCLGLVFVGRTL